LNIARLAGGPWAEFIVFVFSPNHRSTSLRSDAQTKARSSSKPEG
jgi:hypothetical protein